MKNMSYFDFYRKNIECTYAPSKPESIEGTCFSMCPIDEVKLREKENLVHVLEVIGPTRKLVKSYSRSAADTIVAVPGLLRPYSVLTDTVQYLLRDVSKREDVTSLCIYDFVNDRLRAVRQDITIQRLPEEECITLLEPMIRFHVYFGYKLREHPIKDYDPVLNKKYLLECIKWFLNCCDKIDNSNLVCDRVLIESLYILCNLDDVHPIVRYLNLSKSMKSEIILRVAYKIAIANLKGNFIEVNRLVRELCPLTYCAMCLYLPVIQRHTIQVLSRAYNSKRLSVPCEVVARWLHVRHGRAAREVCEHYGLPTDAEVVHFQADRFKLDAPLHVLTDQIILPEYVTLAK